MENKTSAAQLAATKRWEKANIDKLTIKLRKDRTPTKAELQNAAAAAGQSMQAYIVQAIKTRLDQDKEQ